MTESNEKHGSSSSSDEPEGFEERSTPFGGPREEVPDPGTLFRRASAPKNVLLSDSPKAEHELAPDDDFNTSFEDDALEPLPDSIKPRQDRVTRSPFDLTHDFDALDDEVFSEDDYATEVAGLETFGPEQARIATGTYLLTIGYPGSGKSTFHSMLFRYIEDSGHFSYALRPGAGQSEPSLTMQKRMNEWRDRWKTRRFVEPTPALERDVYEIAYSVMPLKGVRARMDFSVIEVSGELLQTLDGLSTDTDISLPSALHELLANRSVKPILVIMVDPDTPKNDLLFKSMMDYIRRSFPDRVAQIPICAVITKPKRALYWLTRNPEWQRKFEGHDKFTPESRTAYLKEFAPGVHAHLKTLDKTRRMLSPFSIGTIRTRVVDIDGVEKEEEYLAKPDFRDTFHIFSWLYEKTTSKRLGKTPLQRLIGALSRPSTAP